MGDDPSAEQIRASSELQALAVSSLHHLPSLGAPSPSAPLWLLVPKFVDPGLVKVKEQNHTPVKPPWFRFPRFLSVTGVLVFVLFLTFLPPGFPGYEPNIPRPSTGSFRLVHLVIPEGDHNV
jgi:hypothetical protein